MPRIIPYKNGTRKDAIALEASRLFKEKGYSATSMREIGEAIGVEAPSLYNHISSKKEILQHICFEVAGLFNTNINEVEMAPIPVLEKMETIIRFHIQMMLKQFEYVYISEHEWRHLPVAYLNEFKNLRKMYRSRLAEIVKCGIAGGEIKSIDPYVAVLIILSAISGIENWHRSGKTIPSELLEESMVKFLLNGLKNS